MEIKIDAYKMLKSSVAKGRLIFGFPLAMAQQVCMFLKALIVLNLSLSQNEISYS
jgi:hypothetical protein